MRTSATLLALLSLAGAAAAADGGIEITLNQAKIVRIGRPADTIIVGNPSIADAAVQDSSTIVLTGKGFGVTNLVVLDTEGRTIIDEEVFVTRNDSRSLRVYRRAAVQTLSCAPVCEGAYRSDAERESDQSLQGN